MYVCLCKAVSEQKIRKVIEQGAATVQQIQEESQAGTNCGTCVYYIENILKQVKSARAEEASSAECLAAAPSAQ